MPRKSLFIFLSVYIVLSVFLLSACKGRMSEEDRIKAVIEDMAAGAEAKDVSRVRGHISRSYMDSAGNDYDAMRGVLAYYFLQPEGISVFLRRQDILVDDGKGQATVRAVISRGKKVGDVKDLIPTEAGGFVFDLEFRKEDGDWMLVSALWREVGVTDAL